MSLKNIYYENRNRNYGNIYFILEGVKIHKFFFKNAFFLSISNRFIIQINQPMQLGLIFHKTLNKLKVWKVHSHRLSSFSAIKKTEWKGGGGTFVLFLSLFLPVHLNFQYKLNCHTSIFIVIFYLFSSIALLILSHLQFHCFFL